MIRKFHEAKLKNIKVLFYGELGNQCGEFLFAEDLADAVIFSMENKLAEICTILGQAMILVSET